MTKPCSHAAWCACTKYPEASPTMLTRLRNALARYTETDLVLVYLLWLIAFGTGAFLGFSNATDRYAAALAAPTPEPAVVVDYETITIREYMVPDACLEAIFGFRNYIADLTDYYNGDPDSLLAAGPDYISEVIAYANDCEAMRTD